jgi:hypothetical protein
VADYFVDFGQDDQVRSTWEYAPLLTAELPLGILQEETWA